jgi:hypothetical protein
VVSTLKIAQTLKMKRELPITCLIKAGIFFPRAGLHYKGKVQTRGSKCGLAIYQRKRKTLLSLPHLIIAMDKRLSEKMSNK